MIKNKINLVFFTCLIIFFLISIITLYSETFYYLSNEIIKKQIIWYLIGFLLVIISKKINFKIIIKFSALLYIILNILLLLLLFIGTEVNGSKCWFIIPKLGSFQPSEFAKIILILINVKIFNWYDKIYSKRLLKDDIKLFFIIFTITLIPSILTLRLMALLLSSYLRVSFMSLQSVRLYQARLVWITIIDFTSQTFPLRLNRSILKRFWKLTPTKITPQR